MLAVILSMIAVQKLVTYTRSIKTQLPHTDVCICRDHFVSVSLVSVTSYNDTYLWYVLFLHRHTPRPQNPR